LPHPNPERLQVFSTSWRSVTAPRLLALFHARSAHGFRPSEHCSSRAAVRRSRRLWPSWRLQRQTVLREPPGQSRRPKSRAWNPNTH